MAISVPTQLATRSVNTAAQTSWPTASITFPAGSRGVLLFDNAGGSNYATGVSDSVSGAWTHTTYASRNVQNWTSAAYKDFASSTTCVVTTAFASSNETFGWVGYISGHDSASGIDSQGNANTFATSLTVTASTALTADDAISFVLLSTGTAGAATTLPAGYTSLSAPSDAVRGFSATFLYRILTGGIGTTESAAATYSASRNLAFGLFTMKPAAGGGTPVVPRTIVLPTAAVQRTATR